MYGKEQVKAWIDAVGTSDAFGAVSG